MNYTEKSLGRNVRFLLPSLKLKHPSATGETVEQCVHVYLMDHFGGYTATAANLFGFWRDNSGDITYGEHREFVVALPDEAALQDLKAFLGRTAQQLGESCLYVESGGNAVLLNATPEPGETPEPICAQPHLNGNPHH